MLDEYGMETKEMNRVFFISYLAFILIFFGFFYRVCVYPCVGLLSDRFFVIILFCLLSYAGAIITCAVYTTIKLKIRKR